MPVAASRHPKREALHSSDSETGDGRASRPSRSTALCEWREGLEWGSNLLHWRLRKTVADRPESAPTTRDSCVECQAAMNNNQFGRNVSRIRPPEQHVWQAGAVYQPAMLSKGDDVSSGLISTVTTVGGNGRRAWRSHDHGNFWRNQSEPVSDWIFFRNLGLKSEGAVVCKVFGIGYESAAGFRRRHFRLTELA